MHYDPVETNRLKQELLVLVANGTTDLTDIAATMGQPLPAIEELVRVLITEKKIKLTRNL